LGILIHPGWLMAEMNPEGNYKREKSGEDAYGAFAAGKQGQCGNGAPV